MTFPLAVSILTTHEAAAPKKAAEGNHRMPWASCLSIKPQMFVCVMTKTIENIIEAVRDPKHSFRKADHQPKKQQKHRYERRKIKEFLNLADWKMEEAI